MNTHTNKLIYAGWLLYIISLFIPWSGKPFGGWLSGWFWQGINFFPFFYFVTFQEAKLSYMGSYALSLSVIIMFISPLLLFLLNRTTRNYYGYIVIAGFLFAFYSLCSLFFEPEPLNTPTLLFVTGYSVYVSSYGVLAFGFIKQISHINPSIN